MEVGHGVPAAEQEHLAGLVEQLCNVVEDEALHSGSTDRVQLVGSIRGLRQRCRQTRLRVAVLGRNNTGACSK